MMTTQKDAAVNAMLSWLMDDHVLKQIPQDLECTNEFDLHQLHYYIFRFREQKHDPWLLGVCGGYEVDEHEHCGHVFSRYIEYHKETEVQDAIDIVEMIRDYWMKRADEEIQRNNNHQDVQSNEESGNFNGFVLMDTHHFDVSNVVKQMKEDWNLNVELSSDQEQSDDAIVMDIDDMLVAISFIDAPVPDNEAEYFAQSNYFWKDGVEVTKRHVSQILLAVLGHEEPCRKAGELFVKIASSALKNEHALGIYTAGTVFEPAFYIDCAQAIKEQDFPLDNLVYFGLYQKDHLWNAYTYGMQDFHKEEMEILHVDMDPMDLRNMLFDIAYYVLTSNVVLKDGETIGFSQDQRLPITFSKGEAVEGNSLKIHLD